MEIKQLKSVIPKNLIHAKFQDLLDAEYDCSRSFVIGKVHKSWPPVARNKPGYLLKCLITEDGNCSQDKLTVYFYDKFANEVHPLSCDTYVAFTGFIREALTMCHPQKELLPFQLLLKPLEKNDGNEIKPEIWVLRSKNNSPLKTYTEQSPGKGKSDILVTATSPRKTIQSSPVKPTNSRSYSYITLGEIKVNPTQHAKYNVFGFVVVCEMKTSSNQRPYMNLVISDETCEKFKCVILGKSEDIFPSISYGDIVRIHRLQVNEYRNKLQGKCFSPSDVVVFNNDFDSSIAPSTSASTYTYSENDKKRVEELRNWKRENDYKAFSQLTYGEYANVFCQVASVSVVSMDTVVLRVWDGTEPACATEPYRGKPKKVTECPELLQSVGKFLVDVRLYDCHAKDSVDIQPKQFVELSNLHLMPGSARRGAMFCLHSGTDYNRHISVLTSDNALIQPIKKKLEDVLKSHTQTNKQTNGEDRDLIELAETIQNGFVYDGAGQECDMDFEFNDSGNFMANLDENLQTIHSPVHENTITDYDRNITLQETDPLKLNEFPRCSEKWWIHIDACADNDHNDIDPTFIKDILKHTVPYKFRIFASVMEIWPSAEKVRNFVYVYCPLCDFLSPEAEMTKSNMRSSNHVYCCPNCSTESTENRPGTSSSAFLLEYTFLVQFLLQDGTAQLKAFLWKENAVEFFREIEPQNLLNEDSIQAQSFREILWRLCPNIKPASSNHSSCEPYPVIDCCIFSYTASDEVNYQIFDTKIT